MQVFCFAYERETSLILEIKKKYVKSLVLGNERVKHDMLITIDM